MRTATWLSPILGAALAALLGAGCAGGAQEEPPQTFAYSAFGFPGPWWREGSDEFDFDTDVGTCRSESTAARTRPGEPDPLDAAYRAFLVCMERLEWTRGVPPQLADENT